VYHTLSRHHSDDTRPGWISGLDEERPDNIQRRLTATEFTETLNLHFFIPFNLVSTGIVVLCALCDSVVLFPDTTRVKVVNQRIETYLGAQLAKRVKYWFESLSVAL
jgi:hypothetical protein